jgi:thioredoxin-dependent peroxiredoxin
MIIRNFAVTLTAAAAMLAATACLSEDVQATKVAKASGEPGSGHTVTLHGNPIPLLGEPVRVGEKLPSALVTAGDMKAVDIAAGDGKVRIISVVPSLDTPVCEAQTHALSEKDRKLADQLDMVTVSMDLPFAQQRFAKEAKIKNVRFYSDHKAAEFGNRNGLLMEPLRLLARAVIVVDKSGVVRYVQVVPEETELPDMAAAMAFAKTLL